MTHLETCTVAEPVRQTGELRRAATLRGRTRRLRVKVETSRITKKIGQRNETNHPGEHHLEEDQPGDGVHQAESVRQFLQMPATHRKSRRRKSDKRILGWTVDTANVNMRRSLKDTRNESPFRKVHERERYASRERTIVMMNSVATTLSKQATRS